MNTFNFFAFWTIMIGVGFAVFKGGDRPFMILGRIAGFIAILLFGLYFLLGAQPRMWG